jgi:hypothetical protein
MSAQLLLSELPGLAGAPSRGAQHSVGHVARLAKPSACGGSIPTAARRQRPIMIRDAVRPRRLCMPQQDQAPSRITRHGPSLSEHDPPVPAGLARSGDPRGHQGLEGTGPAVTTSGRPDPGRR